MNLQKQYFVLSFLCIFTISVFAQFNTDSIEGVWKNKNESPNNRLEAAYQLIIYEYSKIDLELARETAKEMLALSEISNNGEVYFMMTQVTINI